MIVNYFLFIPLLLLFLFVIYFMINFIRTILRYTINNTFYKYKKFDLPIYNINECRKKLTDSL